MTTRHWRVLYGVLVLVLVATGVFIGSWAGRKNVQVDKNSARAQKALQQAMITREFYTKLRERLIIKVGDRTADLIVSRVAMEVERANAAQRGPSPTPEPTPIPTARFRLFPTPVPSGETPAPSQGITKPILCETGLADALGIDCSETSPTGTTQILCKLGFDDVLVLDCGKDDIDGSEA